jgi:DNA polymerase-3 subunit delta
MHATEFLSKNTTLPDIPVLVLYGSERYLKLETLKLIPGLADETEDVALTRTSGKDADLKSVCDELLTVSMFGDKRIVVIDDADDFVSQNRAVLEKYVAHPSKTSLLILDVKSWPKNTKLAKATDKIGLNLECGELKGAALVKWLIRTAAEVHQKQIDRDAAAGTRQTGFTCRRCRNNHTGRRNSSRRRLAHRNNVGDAECCP